MEYADYSFTGIAGQYAGVDEAVDHILLAMTDVIKVHAAVFGCPVEDEVNRRCDGF